MGDLALVPLRVAPDFLDRHPHLHDPGLVHAGDPDVPEARVDNDRSGLALFCPITSKRKGYPFEVALPATGKVTGVVLADQVKSLDWRARRALVGYKAPPTVVNEVLAKLSLLLGQF